MVRQLHYLDDRAQDISRPAGFGMVGQRPSPGGILAPMSRTSLRILMFSLAIGLISCAMLTGCANLEAVRAFAKTSAATGDYRQVVEDYVTSPERQKRYQPERYADRLAAEAEARAQQKARLEGAQTVLVQYLSALGDMAADKLPNVDSEIDGLGKALEKAKFVGDGDAAIKTETATAASAIAKVLVNAVLDHWRQGQVSRIIKETDGSVQMVVAGLREIVLTDFSTSLDIEAEAVRKYFEGPIAAAQSRNDKDAVPPIARILMAEHLDRIEAKRSQLRAYGMVLTKIGEGHSDLNRNVDDLDNKELAQRLKNYGKDLQKLYKAIRQLDT